MPQEETPVAAPDWPDPPPDFVLADDEVHVWCASLDKPASQLAQFSSTLCPGEWQRADRFRFDRHRQWFIVRRGLLRMLLGRYLSVEPDQLVFDCDARGKPSFSEPHNGRTLHFNVSDSSGLVLYALTRRAPLGVDVEHIKPVRDMDGIAARFFSAREKAAIGALSEPQKSEVFLTAGRARKHI